MSLKKNEFDVAIIGAGIAGLALANALDNTHLKVLVIEAGSFRASIENKHDGVADYDARVAALSLNSIRFLQGIGAWSQIVANRSQAFHRMSVWDGEGTGRIAFDAAEVNEQELGHIVENRVIVHSLLENLTMSSNVKLLDNVRIEKIQAITEQDGMKHHIQLGEREVLARLIVGADGAQSYIRKHFGFKTREWDYGHDAIVCTVKTEKPHDGTARQRFMQTGPLALLPLHGPEQAYCSIVWSAEPERAKQLMQMDDAAFCQALTDASEQVLGKIEDCGKRFVIPLRQRHVVDYMQQGVVLVADAAHTIHPLAGLGINLGLQDVDVLAQELIRAKTRGYALNDVCVLSRYQRRRKGENLLVMAAMEGFKRLFEQQSLPFLWLRNKGMTGVGQLSLLKRQIMRQAMGV